MTIHDRRLDLIQRAADRLDDNAANPPAAPRAGSAGGGDKGGGPASGPTVGPGATVARQTQNYAELDLTGLQLAGMVTPNAAPTQLTEEYRILKRPLLLNAFNGNRHGGRKGNVIMVTSAAPNEGKSFTAANLAMSIASEPDLNVLLIDSDAHKQGVSAMLGIEAGEGLVDLLLNDKLDLTEVLIRTNVPNLTILPAGPPYPQATELFASHRMVDFMRDVADRYPDRIIILDAPPVLASSEPGVLALHVGQVLFVVSAALTNRRAVKEALDHIAHSANVSLVLNRAERSRAGGRFGTYDYYDHGRRRAGGGAA